MMRVFSLRTVLLVAAAAGVLVVSGCNKAADKGAGADAAATADAAANLKAGEDFLAKTAKEPGVVTLPSGLMYKVVESPNPSAPKPAMTDMVKVHYEGRLASGKVFDSSYDRGTPAVFPVNKVVEGWQIGIPLMHKGDTYMLYVPAKLGYGDKDLSPDIPPNSALVFKVQLLDIQGK